MGRQGIDGLQPQLLLRLLLKQPREHRLRLRKRGVGQQLDRLACGGPRLRCRRPAISAACANSRSTSCLQARLCRRAASPTVATATNRAAPATWAIPSSTARCVRCEAGPPLKRIRSASTVPISRGSRRAPTRAANSCTSRLLTGRRFAGCPDRQAQHRGKQGTRLLRYRAGYRPARPLVVRASECQARERADGFVGRKDIRY